MMPRRILYLAPCWPFGRAFGTTLRTYQVARALQEVGKLDFVVVKIPDDEDRIAETKRDESLPVQRFIKLRPLGQRSVWGRLRCAFDPTFTGYYGWYVDQQDRLAVLGDLPKYDLVWLHQLRTPNVLGQWHWPHSVMDLDDVDSAFLLTEQKASGLAGRLQAGVRVRIAKRRERLLSERFTVTCVCSEADRRYLGLGKAVHVIPNGFAKPSEEPQRQTVQPTRVGFIGVFEYAPNVEGVTWFVEQCWPGIKERVPDARLRLVGNGSDGPAAPRGPDIDVLGWVEDAAAEIATWSVMVVPLQTGAGTRVKIAEGFSRKCPMVSTSLGAYGYEVESGRELLVADSAADFADACVRLIRDPVAAAAMADRAWRQFLEKWTWDVIRPRIWEAAEDCLRTSTRV